MTNVARLAAIERLLRQHYPADQRLDVALHVLTHEVPWLLDTVRQLEADLLRARGELERERWPGVSQATPSPLLDAASLAPQASASPRPGRSGGSTQP